MKVKLSVVIITFNEEKNIEPTLNTICTAIDDKFSDYEILVFDDGSSESFDLLIGADGIHSNTRELVFGPEKEFTHYKMSSGLKRELYHLRDLGFIEITGESNFSIQQIPPDPKSPAIKRSSRSAESLPRA